MTEPRDFTPAPIDPRDVQFLRVEEREMERVIREFGIPRRLLVDGREFGPSPLLPAVRAMLPAPAIPTRESPW